MAELNALVQTWRQEEPERVVPWFDPADGGTTASVLLLLESPAPSTTSSAGSHLCSEDNADATNRLLRSRRLAAGLPRSACVKWNAVPWASTTPHRAPDLARAASRLRQVLAHLPRLQVVITFGGTAAAVLATASTQADPPVLLPALAVPHPSQRNTRARQEALERIDRALTCAAGLVRSPLVLGALADRPSAPRCEAGTSARS
ncbi:uracil-DNA glycosylase family protein [Quadrisphaera setariae]|uniref:uracil-DNA glycosylase family protein n=1 Tax=Quadrisphaera setariae TaxID=2593304 RepID=UPI00164EF095|nr:uracil-DNA glycosylase family protein [Quadrisphaera setariae]